METIKQSAPLATQRRRALDLCVSKPRVNIADMVRQPTTWALGEDGDFSRSATGPPDSLRAWPSSRGRKRATNFPRPTGRPAARICPDDYLEFDSTLRDIRKMGEAGDGVGKAKYVFTSWGDYYVMEGVACELGRKINRGE